MLQTEIILFCAFMYMGLLFAIAHYGDKRAKMGSSIVSNPYIYALSLAVYCTAWTFYGSVGRAADTGTGFLPIYIGPTLMAALGWLVLRKIIRISKVNRITSIADFIASRYGKSTTLAGVVTIIAVLGIIPYISVQIKAISTTFLLINQYPTISMPADFAEIPILKDTAFFAALLLAVFTVLFGTRHLEATERHEGLVAAIAFESLVKLIAFLAAGLFVTYGLYNGLGDLFGKARAVPEISRLFTIEIETGAYVSWSTTIVLSMMAFVFLPRQFQVIVVENVNEDHLKKAIWLIPLYLLAINIFVLPVAFGGLLHFVDGGIDADYFVLTLPMAMHQEGLVLLVFIGGISAATGMVIVETIALSTMICNDLVMPVLLRLPFSSLSRKSDLSTLLLAIRRGSIILVLLLGYSYFHFFAKYMTLVSIGMISFVAVAQFGPAILGGIFWKEGTRAGALCGLIAGFLIWMYALLLPSIAQSGILPINLINEGPFGIEILKPLNLFGFDAENLGIDPYVYTLFLSMFFNLGAYIGVSLFTRQTAVEHTQATLFVDVFKYSAETGESSFWRGTASIPALRALLGRFLGKRRAQDAIAEYMEKRRIGGDQESTADAGLISHAEKLLAGTIGSASARVMIASVVKEEPLGIGDVMHILDETRQVIIYSRELEKATAELKAANERLKELDRLKNEFISTVTHELRTPLTSIRALAEILHDTPDIDLDQQNEFSGIIVRESERLSRLINDVLDFQKIESGKIEWQISKLDFEKVVTDSIVATKQLVAGKNIALTAELPDKLPLITGDRDRLMQVMLNLLFNAVKFCGEGQGKIHISLDIEPDYLRVDITDNGIGISPKDQEVIFMEFRQVDDPSHGRPDGTGIGLTICRRIIDFHGGRIWVKSTPGEGSTFSFTLPKALKFKFGKR